MPLIADTADREIVIRRVFAAPPALVFAAWTDPQHIGHWWGPDGFTTTTSSMEVRPGGEWRYVMHGPDGTDYENWIRYTVVDRPARLEYAHGGAADAPAHFQVTVTFTPVAAGTEVTMRSVFPSAADRDEVVHRYGAIEGGKQTLARFGEHLAGEIPTRVTRRFTRTFAAPRNVVFTAWTAPRQLARWWGPHDFTNPTCVFEARVGGAIDIAMRDRDGGVHPMRGTVREIEPPSRLVFLAQPLDSLGAPMFEVINTVEFTEVAGGTTVTVETVVRELTPAAKIPLSGMDVGWTQSLERLADFLAAPVAVVHPECDIVSCRIIPAARERVFAAWTDPAVLARWWGPHGFTNTFSAFDLRPGGDWRFVMRGPDGREYPNHSRFVTIEPNHLLVFDHLGSMHAFQVYASFYDLNGGTLVRFRMRFADAAECAQVRVFAEPCNEQNFDRLEAVLASQP